MMDVYLLAIHTCLEMLPISSSSHLHIILGYDVSQTQTHAAHGPATLVFAAYIVGMIYDLLLYRSWHVILRWILCGIIADGVVSCAYLVSQVYGFLDIPVWLGMGITAGVLVWISHVRHSLHDVSDPTYRGALWVGCAQAVALLPGVSRLATTYAAGRMAGWSHRCAFTFTCALVVPLYGAYWIYDMSAGTAYIPQSGYELVVCMTALMLAYGLLFMTDYLYVTRRAWYFAVYVAVMAVMVGMIYDE